MGPQSGKHGSKSLRYRATTSAAVSRLRSALPSSVSLVGFELQDNSDFDIVKSRVYNPLSQDELIAKINAEEASGDLVLSIISTWHLKDLSGVTVTVCDQIKGLVLFENLNMTKEAIIAFLARCPNLEALVLASDAEASLLQSIFQSNSFPKLRFLEVSEASDHAIAAMASAPNLQKIIVRSHDLNLTNKGFGRLVKAGGGKSLKAVTVKIAKHGPLCKTVSKFYLMATLPVFCAGNGKESDLQQMIWGKQMQTQASADMKTRILAASKPFATVPISLMTFAQLMAALENRGVSIPTPRSTDNFRQTLIDYGFTLEEEAAIQARKKAKAQSGSKPASVKQLKPSVAKPFAVIPVELMTFTQLIAALENRGESIPNPRTTDNFRQALFDCGFTLEEEAAIQARKRAQSGSKPVSRKLPPATKPYAVIPVEFMSFAQLIAALEDRGVPLPASRSTDAFRQALFDYGFTLEEEAGIQARKKAESECKPESLKRPLTGNSVANASKPKTRK